MTSFLIFWLIPASTALATEPKKVACTVEVLTEYCWVFDEQEDKPYFTFSDGTLFRNPGYRSPEAPIYESTYSESMTISSVDSATMAENMEAQRKLQELQVQLQYEIVTDERLPGSPFFKLALTSPPSLMSLNAILAMSKEDLSKLEGQMQMTLPWPADTSEQTMKQVDVKTFKKQYLDKIDPKALNRIKAMLSNYFDELKNLSLTPQESVPYSNSQNEPVRKRLGITAHREQQVEKHAETIRQLLLDEIARGRDPKSLNHDEKVMYKKVETVEFTPLSDELADSPSCADVGANAFYDREAHAISLCPDLYLMPQSSLVTIVAHEFAHSIDNCNIHSHIFRRTQRSFDEEEFTRKASAEGLSERSVLDTVRVLISTLKSGDHFAAPLSSPEQSQMISFLLKDGYVVREVEGLPHNRLPYRGAFNCVQNRTGFRMPSPAAFMNFLKEVKKNLKNHINAWNEISLEEGRNIAQRAPQCLNVPGVENQAGEASADMWAAKVLGRYLELNPPRSLQDKLAPFAAFYSEMCHGYDENYENLPEKHLRSRERMNDIFLTDVRVQNALKCKGSSKDHCLRSIGTLPSSKSKTKKPVTPSETTQ